MSQHDFDLTTADANTGPTVRAGINAMAQALASNNSGATEPSTKYANMWWADTTSGFLKQRNDANSAWIEKGLLSDILVGGMALQKQTYTAFTTAGTSTAFTLTPSPAISSNTAMTRLRATFHTAAGADPTLAVSGQAALPLKYRGTSGTLVACGNIQIPSGLVADVETDGTNWVILNPAGAQSDSTIYALNGQVNFPSTQNASSDANTLDDYEEGTWAGALVAGTSGTITMGNNAGKYVKIGGLVTITGLFDVSSVSSPTGLLELSGLPFAAGGLTGNYAAAAIRITTTGDYTGSYLNGHISPGSSVIKIFNTTTLDGTDGSNTAALIKANTAISVSCTYLVV